jgi:ABC-2 type transport system permease protein
VDRVSLTVQPGEIFGLLGPNGAGKSTLVRVLCTLILPSAGQARICGHDLSAEAAVKAQIGLAAGEERSFYWRLTGRENLRFYGALQGFSQNWIGQRIQELNPILELSEALEKRFDRLSTGMRRRLDLARALLHKPAVLFLDEPTRSLDPSATARLHERIQQIAQAGQTIFLVTHSLGEAESLCDRVAIMHMGQLRALAPVSELREIVQPLHRYRLTVTLPEDTQEPPWIDWSWPTQVQPLPQSKQLLLHVETPTVTPLDELLHPLTAAGFRVVELDRQSASLEQVFDYFTKTVAAPAQPTQVLRKGATPSPLSHSIDSQPSTTRGIKKEEDRTPRLSVWPATLHKTMAFLRRDLRVQISYRLATLLQMLGILFSVAAFYFVGRLFGDIGTVPLEEYGGDYFPFVLVGIAFVGYQSVGLYSFSRAIQTGQTQGTLEAMLVTPTKLETILLASSLWSFMQASLQVLVYLLIGRALFGASLGNLNLGTALLVLILSILAFSGLGILSASFILVAKRGNPVNFLFGGISTLLSGVYYPIAVLPSWLQWTANFLPMTHTLRAMRLALLQGARLGQVLSEVALLGLFTLVILPGSLFAFRWALRRARIEGTLTQF